MWRKIAENLVFQYLESLKPKGTVSIQLWKCQAWIHLWRLIEEMYVHNLIITKSFVKTFKHENNCHLWVQSINFIYAFSSSLKFCSNYLWKLLWLRKFSKLHQIVKCFSIRICLKCWGRHWQTFGSDEGVLGLTNWIFPMLWLNKCWLNLFQISNGLKFVGVELKKKVWFWSPVRKIFMVSMVAAVCVYTKRCSLMVTGSQTHINRLFWSFQNWHSWK